MIERRHPLPAATQGLHKVLEKRSVLKRTKTRSFHEEAVKHDRMGRPVVCRDASHEQGARHTRSSNDSKSFNVED